MSKYKGGLLTSNDSPILGNGNDVNQTINLTTLNKLQAVTWEINPEMITSNTDILKEASEDLTSIELKNRSDAFIQRNIETDAVIENLLQNGNRFYFLLSSFTSIKL